MSHEDAIYFDGLAKEHERVIEHNAQMILGPEFDDLLGSESIGGNAGEATAAIRGFYDRKTGEILAFSLEQTVPERVSQSKRSEAAPFSINVHLGFPLSTKNVKYEILYVGHRPSLKANVRMQDGLKRAQEKMRNPS